VTGEHDRALALQVTGETGYAREHLERRHIDIGEGPTPPCGQAVNLVLELIVSVTRHLGIIS